MKQSSSQEFENYAASDDGTSMHSYDYLDSPRSNASHPKHFGHSQNDDGDDGLPNYSDLPPPPFPGGESPAAPPPPGLGHEDYSEEDSFPPETRDESPSLTGLPPPPSYMDVFTASGRAKDSVTVVPASARSNLPGIPDDEDNAYYGSGHLERPPPFEAHSDDPLPPPPVYSDSGLASS
ncbi:hypothetical protein ON010_g14402 [Phytophthora cinnamomi]|nr:hypothetical protein ON010_g14402 [Phytophthora cinnamomi]